MALKLLSLLTVDVQMQEQADPKWDTKINIDIGSVLVGDIGGYLVTRGNRVWPH